MTVPLSDPVSVHGPFFASSDHFDVRTPGYQDCRFVARSDLGQLSVPQFPHQ